MQPLCSFGATRQRDDNDSVEAGLFTTSRTNAVGS